MSEKNLTLYHCLFKFPTSGKNDFTVTSLAGCHLLVLPFRLERSAPGPTVDLLSVSVTQRRVKARSHIKTFIYHINLQGKSISKIGTL